MNLSDIQKRAEALSKTRDCLTGLFRTLEQEITTVKNGSLPEIKRVARQIARQHTELQELIAANPALFAKPRTYVVDGLKFGMQKKVGKLQWEDDAKLVGRIEGLTVQELITPEQQDMLITTVKKPVAKALEKLDGKLLKRLGVTLTADSDEPLIKSVDGEVEKAVNAIIKDATQDTHAGVSA
ncbi:MAG: hypothetical protein EAZ30_17640 [Betaproteobacteria bacterium]|nr:MAG: hypothetical protein EAZ30_17640 [Betaproteobacteria bacterium]